MSSQQKFYLSFSLLVLFLGYASFIGMSYKKEQLSQEVIIDNSIVSTGNTSSTGITLITSGSNQSGSVSSSWNTTKFKKPNTEWKTRTLSGITYVFGEGNPKEVALSQEDLGDIRSKCGTNEDPDNTGYLCKESDGYVTVEVETSLLSALASSAWTDIFIKCKDNLSIMDAETSLPKQFPNSENIISYDIMTNTDILDINKWITIDPISGRKVLDANRMLYVQQWLIGGSQAKWQQFEWPLDKGGVPMVFKNPSCVDSYGTEIIRNLSLANEYYKLAQGRTLDKRMLDKKTFKIFY